MDSGAGRTEDGINSKGKIVLRTLHHVAVDGAVCSASRCQTR